MTMYNIDDYKISVVIPNFNGARFIDRAILSAINQTHKPHEIIVVDDGSTDDSLEILSKYQSKIKVFPTFNFGASAARNLGIISSTGNIIALLDSDDYWAREKLQLQISEMHSTASDIVYCQGVEVDINGAKIREHRSNFFGDCYGYFILNPTISIFPLPCSSIVFRKSLISRSGLFDTKFLSFAEDWDFFRRLSEYSKVGRVDQCLVFYVRHSANSTNAKLMNHFNGNRRALKKAILDNKNLTPLFSIKIWLKFYFIYLKSLVKSLSKSI